MIDDAAADAGTTSWHGSSTRAYWLATAHDARGPHVRSAGSPSARGAQRGEFRVALRLPDFEEVTIVRGTPDDLGDPAAHGPGSRRWASGTTRPRRRRPPSAPGSTRDVLYRLESERALTGSLDDVEASQRRWPARGG